MNAVTKTARLDKQIQQDDTRRDELIPEHRQPAEAIACHAGHVEADDLVHAKISRIPSLIRIAVAGFVLLYMPHRAHSSTAHSTSTLPAPATAAQNAYAGCLVAPDDSVFNTPVDALPVHINSTEWISQSLTIGSVGTSFGASWDVNLVDDSVTPSAMTFHYTTSRNGMLYPLLTGNHRTRETGSYTTDGNSDHHMITLNRQTCHWYETYQDNLTGSVTPTPAPYAASGWDYLGSSYIHGAMTSNMGRSSFRMARIRCNS